jgi:hypothetical protein
MKIRANKLPQRDGFSLRAKGQLHSGSNMLCLIKKAAEKRWLPSQITNLRDSKAESVSWTPV